MNTDSSPPDVSIITVNTNELHRLRVYLPALRVLHGRFELIISDNGSSDGSIEYIEQTFPEARIVKNGDDLGFARACNRGAAFARADVLTFLTPDTIVEPHWLLELVRPFKHSTVGATTSKILLMRDPTKVNTCGNDVHISGLTLCRGIGQSRDSFSEEEEVAAVSGTAFAIRRNLFEQVGGFNEVFFMYMEETSLSLETWLRGFRCVYTPRSIVRHDYALRFGPQKVLLQERNRYLMLLQLYRWRTLVLLVPTLLLAEIVAWGFVITRDRKNWKNKFRAYADVLTHWPVAMRKRRLNQIQRKASDRSILERTSHRLDFGQVAEGAVGKVASSIFDPLFWTLRKIMLILVRW